MDTARVLRQARRRAGLTQRQLADRAGVPQSRIGKIESGVVVPRVDTFDRLLEACGETLEAVPRPGIGLDRTGYQERLRLSPRGRLVEARKAAVRMARRLEHARR